MVRVSLVPWVAVSAAACGGASATPPSSVPTAPAPTGHYSAAFPFTDLSEELDRVFEAVKEIQVRVDYDVYSFPEESAPAGTDLMFEDVTDRAVSVEPHTEVRRATAVLLSRSATHLLFLTAAHAVFRADTIVEYVGPARDGDPDPTRKIRTLSIKRRQANWVLDLPRSRVFDILASDEDEDLALIGFQILPTDRFTRTRPMPVAGGDPGALATGSFVYVLGFPGGYRLVSRGIATPLEGGRDAFVIDGNWNQGVSGGPILAIRGDGLTLEWVGMARAATAVAESRVVPPASALEQQDPRLPYEGPIFLEETLRIQYGLTLSVPMTSIRRFVERNGVRLAQLGYEVPVY
jgi:hypothetical protein